MILAPACSLGPRPGWTVRSDTDRSRAFDASELGGTVVQGPDDAPCGVLATIVDPTGLGITIRQP